MKGLPVVSGDELEPHLQVLVEGIWTSEEIYDNIHDSEEWLEATSRFGDMWDQITAVQSPVLLSYEYQT